MQIKNLNNTAFSLLEVLLAAIIFIISIGGVFVTLTAIRKPVADKESALSAAVFGKQVLESLRSSVNTSTYYTCSSIVSGACVDFSLYLGPHQVTLPAPPNCVPTSLCWPSTALSSDNNNGVLTYTVSCADGSQPYGSTTPCTNPDSARRVDLNIKWPEAP